MENRSISLFKGYSDTEPIETSLEEVVNIIKCDAALRDRTEKHRYYLEQDLKRDAEREKSGCPCFAVAVHFEGGKTREHVRAWTGYTLVDLDHIPPERLVTIWTLICADEHTLLAYITISSHGIRVICRIEGLNGLEGEKAFRRYAKCFNLANDYYSHLVDFKSDGQCKNATRISGMAADPNVYYNPDATPFVLQGMKSGSQPQGTDVENTVPAKRNKRLEKAVKAAERFLEEEGVAYCEHHHNEYVMRMGYLLNQYGVAQKTAAGWAVERFTDYDGDVAGVIGSCYENADEHGTRSFSRKGGQGGDDKFATVMDIEQFFTQQAKFRKNVVSGKFEILMPEFGEDYMELTDRYINTLWARMSKAFGMLVRATDMRAVLDSEYTPLFNPFEEYLKNLPVWDGTTDAIAQLASGVHVKDDQDLFGLYFKKWLVAVIASLVDPTVVNHEILVFVGKQGIYKTTWMQRLLPPELQRYFYVKSNSQHIKKDDLFTLTEFALVCLEELEEMTSVQVGQLKAITSMNMVNERASYGHFKESRPHVASFCGTTNNSTFLNDLSGNRRWLPFEVEAIDSPFDFPIDYTGVYAQGYALWKSGFHYWFDPKEIEVVNLHNRFFEVPCLERELVQVYYRRPLPGEECMFLTNAQILSHINAGIRQTLSPTRLGLVMKQEGYEAVRSGGRRGYRVIELKGDEIYRNQCAMARYTAQP